MDIGIGLPTTVPGTHPRVLADWARAADQGPFASLGVLDRIRYDSYEPLMTLAGVATVTERIPLVTSILVAPLREVATLAKQVITLDVLSGGRLTLGTAIGARGDDYDLDEFGRTGRGDRHGEQLQHLRDLWEEGTITPSAATREEPRLLVGGMSGPAFGRMARHADGWIFSGGPPRVFARQADQALAAWTDHGRPGRPLRWAMDYFALGDAADDGRTYLLDYYAFTGPFATRLADGLLASPLQVREHVQGLADAGCDHLILFPAVADPGQLELLADVVEGIEA